MKQRPASQLSAFPTRAQQLLLNAALLPPAQASAAWLTWAEAASPIRDARFVAGLLLRNLQGLPALPRREELAVLAARAGAKTRRAEAGLRATLRILRERGIPALLLKGAALRRTTYAQPGLRPSLDNDVLVPPASALPALAALLAAGASGGGLPRTADDLRWAHAVPIVDPLGGPLDLHWHVLSDSCGDHDDEPWWADSWAIECDGLPARVLSPADQLLHVLAHGLRWCERQPPRWVSDAVMLLRGSGAAIDWAGFCDRAAQRHLAAPVRGGLRYLAATFPGSVPEEPLRRLAAARRAPLLDEWAFRARLVAPQARGLRGRLALHVHEYQSRRRALALGPGLRGLGQSVARTWGVSRLRELPGAALRRLASAR